MHSGGQAGAQLEEAEILSVLGREHRAVLLSFVQTSDGSEEVRAK